MFKIILLFFFSLFCLSQNILAKTLKFEGLTKLNLDDIQSITSQNIFKNDLSINELNAILKDLLISDLIYEVEYLELEKEFLLKITESDLIENIYINKNVWIDDEIIIKNLSSKQNSFLSKNNIQEDLSLIQTIYKTKGFQDTTVIVKVERFSQDRINLIYEINESEQQKINIIKFIGNNFYSNNYLNSLIKSQSIKFYNIFKSGSNLNYSLFEFDKNQILSSYRDDGFSNVKVSYTLEKTSLNNNTLFFYIDEGERKKINNIEFEFKDQKIDKLLIKKISDFRDNLESNSYFYSKELIDNYLELFNASLISNNIFNKQIDVNIDEDPNYFDIYFYSQVKTPITINKIEIIGNSITKNETIRSKISLEPGQYLNQYTLENSIKVLERYPYINKVNAETNLNNQLADIIIDIDEETKTGNILVAGTFNADTGAGLSFGIEDKNIFGSGNSVSSNFTGNSEDIKFDLNYIQYPILNPNLTNTYTIFNQDNDYTNSFGFEASRRGVGYSINFKQNDELSYNVGLNYSLFKGHSAVDTTTQSISDNIGNFENYKLDFSINYNTSNDYFNPTDGTINKFKFTLSPEGISDDSFYKLILTNKNYKEFKNSKNYLFFNNNYGYAKSSKGKLKTINAFGLGGLNFRGFDYKGIGPYDGKIYLGGNEYFTSTIGYGSSFIFDDKDNINIKFFLTTGSIWNSDYTSSSDIDLRTSIGTSLDFITPIGPISLSYASPIEKNNTDRTRQFNFVIGTSF
tara:strand:+ start:7196 stop:9433 length:2238 start_codon:yes stop_codon:yes gene_type:complete